MEGESFFGGMVLDTQERRVEIGNLLSATSKPITGKELAERFSVSRQVIVQDIALLRAGGANIIATPQGYIIPKLSRDEGLEAVVAICHDQEGIAPELNAMVDVGATVVDVIVEHPLYGELRGLLMLSSRLDVDRFVRQLEESEARPLSALTGGVHLHTLRLPSMEALDELKQKLRKMNMLLE